MSIPRDPVILLSYINTQLRDHYKTLEDLCKSLDIDPHHLTHTLQGIDYIYDQKRNQFI